MWRIAAACMLVAAPVAQARAQQHDGQPSEMSQAARAAWGFDADSVAPHPGVRFGVLANGMRYAVMRSAAPAGALSVRMRLAVGAGDEGEREQGFAHLVEHMIFHGSENFPQGSLPLMLPRDGLRRWSDFNAFTSYDETVYRLDLARSDERARETALVLMREVVGRLRFTPEAVRGARDEVREEIRRRDAVADRLLTAQNAFFAPGTPIARGPVAGTAAGVARARAEALRRFYEAHYVPQATILVVVGDFDPVSVEAEIARHFGDWQPRGVEAAERTAAPVRDVAGTEARLFVDPAAPTGVTIASLAPLGRASDTAPRRDAHFLERLGSDMLSRRLARTGSPVASASAAVYDHFSAARVASIELAARDRDWRGALMLGARELRRALKEGFSQAELDEQLMVSRSALTRDAAPRTTPELADAIIDAAGRGIVFTEPGHPAAVRDYLARVRLADVNAAFRAAWARPGRLIFVSHNRRIPGGEGAIRAAWEGAVP